MAVWSQAWYIVAPLVCVILGQWALLLNGMFSLRGPLVMALTEGDDEGILLNAAWAPGQGCAITKTRNTILAATFIYTMCFDFAVLVLTAAKLGVMNTSRRDRSKIVKLIFEDGLIYFMVA